MSTPAPSAPAALPRFKFDLALLGLCQGLLLTHNVAFIAVNGLVGLALAPNAVLATLPVTGYVLGGALATLPVARSMRRLGRKRAFLLGMAVGLAATALCAYAAAHKLFGLLVAGTFAAGYFNANGALYRFAAAELVPPAWKERAISLVLAGGLIGAVLGPNLATRTRDWLPVPFAGVYLALLGVGALGMLAMAAIRFPAPPGGAAAAQSAAGPGRPLRAIAADPRFVVAVLGVCAAEITPAPGWPRPRG